MNASGAAARSVAAVRKAFEQATQDIASEKDRLAAVAAAGRLADGIREVFEEASSFRAQLIVAIVDTGYMTRKELAAALGLSRRRVDQLYNVGRPLGSAEE